MRKSSSFGSFRFINVGMALSLTVFGAGLGTSAWANNAANGQVELPGAGLSAVLKKNLSGLQFDDPEAKANIATLREQAKVYVQYRRGRMPTQKKLQWMAECLKQSESNVFCDGILERRARKDREDDEASMKRASVPAPQVAQLLARGSLKPFRDIRDSSINRGLKTFGSWEPLKEIAEEALDDGDCSTLGLLTGLGQKAEEFFPDPKFKKIAVDFYSKAAQCESSEAADKARYRLSMIHLWDNACAKAEPHLTKLSEQKNGDYVSRSLFWRSQCAKNSGNKMLYTSLKGRLYKEYPLSYHGLLLSKGKTAGGVGTLVDDEPMVMFRSKNVKEINDSIRAIEILNEQGAGDLASDLLDRLENRVDSLEVPVRLYAAVLLSRAGDRIGQFRMLASVFRDQPATISRASLKLFYPLQRFDVLKRYQSKIDPYLVAALIRQESGFNERARSPAGAMGLMQLMPATARRMERVSKRELFDAKTNIRLGVKYFHQLINRFDGDAELALAGYNAGPERVDDWKRRYPTTNRMLFFDLIPFRETRDYVALIVRNYYWYLSLYGEPEQNNRSIASSTSSRPYSITLFDSRLDVR